MSATTPTAHLHEPVVTTRGEPVAFTKREPASRSSYSAAAPGTRSGSFADSLRTLVDRTLDAVRGRFDL